MSLQGHVESLRELERALEAFMASHVDAAVAVASSSTQDEDEDACHDDIRTQQVETPAQGHIAAFHRDLRRLQWLTRVFSTGQATSSAVVVGETLLGWLQAVESSNAAVAASAAVDVASSPPSVAEAAQQAQYESAAGPVASWLVATLLRPTFEALQTEKLAARAIDHSLRAFQRACEVHDDAQRRARAEAGAGGFFAFTQHLTLRGKPKLPRNDASALWLAQCAACTTQAATAWSRVLALVASRWPEEARPRLQSELQTRAVLWGATKPPPGTHHAYLRHLTRLRLELEAAKRPETTRWMRVLLPLLLKPQRSHVRGSAATLVAHVLARELDVLETQERAALYASTGGDWSRCVGELHAAAFRLTDYARRKSRGRSQQQLEAAAWRLRVEALTLAPRELFARYWREDVLALLRLQYQLNQDASGGASAFAMLPILERSFTKFLERHSLEKAAGNVAAAPSDTDCMEIINTTQAWAFFSLPRLRPRTAGNSSSVNAFFCTALPALVRMSRAIARYNAVYAVQSHLRRLLTEPSGVGDPQKLVGLEALQDVLGCSWDDEKEDMDRSALQTARPLLGELVGRVLVECSTRMGHELLSDTNGKDDEAEDENDDKDPARAVAVATFAAALRLLPELYTHLAPSNDQKLLLLARASVHAERRVRHSASEALLTLSSSSIETPTVSPVPGVAAIVRVLTDYLMRTSVGCTTSTSGDTPGAVALLSVLSALVSAKKEGSTRWESMRAQMEALTQVEAVCIYLLAGSEGDAHATKLLRLTTLETLHMAHEARIEALSRRNASLTPLGGRPSVLTLLESLETQLHTSFFTFHERPVLSKPDRPLPVLRWLIEDTTTFTDAPYDTERRSFRWSETLSCIFPKLAKRAPDVTAYIWGDVADKVAQLEPVVALTATSSAESPQLQSRHELARWRNLALLGTATACSTSAQARKLEVPGFTSATSSFSSITSSSEATSVIPTATVAALVRQLACYLRSSSAEQRKAAVLALGHASNAALAVLLDVLARLEQEAFTTSGKEHTLSAVSPSALGRSTRSSRTLKLSRKKLLELQRTRATQLQLRRALARCFRLLLENRQSDELHGVAMESNDGSTHERLRCAAWVFLGKLAAVLDGETATNALETELGPMHFMVQQDFSASLRVLLQTRPASSTNLSVSSKKSPPPTFAKLTNLLLRWCGSFSETLVDSRLSVLLQTGGEVVAKDALSWTRYCDVHTVNDGGFVSPWFWLDSSLSLYDDSESDRPPWSLLLQYFVCRSAFSALEALVRASTKTADSGDMDASNSSVIAWLDECFSLDTATFPHLLALQHLARCALSALLELSPPGSVRFRRVASLCLTKAEIAFTTPANATEVSMRVARQYLTALGNDAGVMSFFRCLLERLATATGVRDEDDTTLTVHLLHMLLLHVGVASKDGKHQPQYRQSLLDMVTALVCSPHKDSETDDDTIATARWGLQGYYSSSTPSTRLQISVSTLLAGRFPALGLRVSLVVLRSISQALESGVSCQHQRQMLDAVLPWLAEVTLGTPCTPPELLIVAFELTEVLYESCGEQLDHVWLTLAFARGDGNLDEIVAFLFAQQCRHQTQETAKRVLWWLCRWQDAAPDVLRCLLLQPQSRAVASISGLDGSTESSPLQAMAALVALASHSSHQLLQSSVTWSGGPVRALAVHLMHAALATVFALQDNSDLTLEPIVRDCHTLLHDVLPLLEAPRGLLASALTQIREATTSTSFHEALQALASCLSAAETELWSELCVRDIALAIASESLEASTKSIHPPEACVRFALVAYARLETQFHGDVLLSTLALLRQALNAQDDERGQQWPSPAQMLAKECLALLTTLARRMPAARLLLYPQVLWVTLALLTHCRQQPAESIAALHEDALGLLDALLDRVALVRHAVMPDLLRYARPTQWGLESARSSVLMELVRSANASGSSLRCRTLALAVLRSAVLLVPRDLLGVSNYEHLVICTLGLLPTLVEPSKSDEKREQDVRGRTCGDLAALWQSAGSCKACDRVVDLLQNQEFDRTGTTGGRELATTFVAAFVPAIRALEQSAGDFDGLGLSLEVLTFVLPQPLASSDDHLEVHEEASGGDWTFVLLEEILREVQRSEDLTLKAWQPASELQATLARFMRHPRNECQWQAAVRVLGCLSDMSSSGAGTCSPTGSPTSKPTLSMDPGYNRKAGRAASVHSLKPNSAQTITQASTLQKSPPTLSLLQFVASRSRSINTISKSFRSEGSSTNNNSEAPPSLETVGTKLSHPSEPSDDHELRPPSNNVRITATERG